MNTVIIVYRSRITEHLGSGEFGTVCKGMWHTEQGELDVAVKMLNCKASEEATVRFLQEAAIMGQFRHPNIVRLHGVITVGEPVGGLIIHTSSLSQILAPQLHELYNVTTCKDCPWALNTIQSSSLSTSVYVMCNGISL